MLGERETEREECWGRKSGKRNGKIERGEDRRE
jgi:hypothetical protein